MAKYARIENDVAVEVINGSPAGKYHPEVAALFVQVPAGVKVGSTRSGDEWSPPQTEVAPEARRMQLSPPEYLMLFTAAERVAMRKSDDDLVADYLAVIADPRLASVDLTSPAVKDGHDALAAAKLITAKRRAEIEQGLAL